MQSENIETSQESSNEEVVQELSLRDHLEQSFERARDEEGKFTAKEPEAPTEEVKPEAITTEVAPEELKPEVKAVKPPDSWSPAAKAKFNELPPEIQQEVMRREEEVHKGFTKFDEERVLGKQLKDVINPYLPMIKAEGGDVVGAVNNLLQTAYMLRQNPKEAILNLAQRFGVDLGVQAPQQNQYVDPTVQQLQEQVFQMQQQQQYQQYMVEQQENAQVHSTIESFASDPANIYFSNVKPQMAILLQNGQAQTLQEAYDMACWARPDIRPLLLQSQQKQEMAKKQEQAQKARKTAASISGSPVGVSGSTPQGESDLREMIRSGLREAQGRI